MRNKLNKKDGDKIAVQNQGVPGKVENVAG